MKRKYYISGGLISFFLIFCNLYTCSSYTKAIGIQDSLLVLKENISNKIFTLELQKENRHNEMIFNGKELNISAVVTNLTGHPIRLCDIINEKKLILRYSELNCNTCIDVQINNLNRYADSIGVQNILLFTTYQNHTYMQRFKKLSRIKFEIYNIGAELNSVLTDIGLPYFFVLTPSENRVQSMYIPQKESNSLTKDYLILIKRKYFN